MANQTKYFKTPFAESGTRAEVPNNSVGGAVGFDTGFGPDYELPQGSAGRKRIERDKYNGLHHSITKNLKQWQEKLYPTWIEDAGTGTPFSYPVGMIVNHAGQNWVSNDAANIEEPGTGTKWDIFSANFKYKGAGDAVVRSFQNALSDRSISVKDFGAAGDGINDDAPAIQAAINYAHSIGGGAVYFPKPVNYYALKTTSTTTTGKLACLIVPAPTAFYGDPISLISDSPLNPIRVETPLSTNFAGVYFEGFSLYKQMVNLDIWGGVSSASPLCDYVVFGADDYHANMMITGCRFYVAVEDCIRLATYATTMTNVQTAYAKRGFKLAGPDEVNDVVTSLTLNSCYGLECSENAFWFGNTTYCTLNSCASDHIGQFPYRFGIARAVTMNACGAESSPKILKAITAQGLQINGIYTLSIGDNLTPPTSLIEIDGGSSVTLSGLHLQNPLAYGKKISLGSVFAEESVTILDSSVTPSEVSFVPNYTHSNPFKFVVWDKSTRDFTWAITDMNSLVSVLESFDNTSQNHVQTLQFPDGDFTLDSAVLAFNSRVNGGGSIIFKGGVNSRIVVAGSNQFSFGDTPATLNIVFEDIELHMDALSGISQGFAFYGRNTRFKNSNITSFNGFVQYAIYGAANLFFDSNSDSLTAPFTIGGEYTVRLQPRSTIPTGYHANGAIAYKDVPDATTKGWISGAGGWFAF